jgi:hypothetical protein
MAKGSGQNLNLGLMEGLLRGPGGLGKIVFFWGILG